MLPAEKTSFPKCLYLDQNKWIDLARAHYGQGGGEPFEEALAAIRRAVDAERLVVPMSGVHVMETMAPADEGRRRRLAEFMVDLSRNTSMLPYMSVRGLEVLQAVVRKLGLPVTQSVRPGLLKRGLAYALGAEAEITGVPSPMRAELEGLLASPETTVQLLVDAGDRATIAEARRQDERAVEQLEEIRRRANADLTPEQRHRVELAELFAHGDPGHELRAVLRALGVGADAFFGAFADPADLMAFFHDIPAVDLFVTLGLERDSDMQRRIHRNDLKDIAFLSVAVPYANFIVLERFWAAAVRRRGLHERYGTEVLVNLTELPGILADRGCLP